MRKAIRSTAVLLLLVTLAGCAGKNQPYVPHPGSVDVKDSKMYDALLAWRGALDEAKKLHAEGKLSGDTAKAVINKAGGAYDVMRGFRQSYVNALKLGDAASAADYSARWDNLLKSTEQLIGDVIALTVGK